MEQSVALKDRSVMFDLQNQVIDEKLRRYNQNPQDDKKLRTMTATKMANFIKTIAETDVVFVMAYPGYMNSRRGMTLASRISRETGDVVTLVPMQVLMSQLDCTNLDTVYASLKRVYGQCTGKVLVNGPTGLITLIMELTKMYGDVYGGVVKRDLEVYKRVLETKQLEPRQSSYMTSIFQVVSKNDMEGLKAMLHATPDAVFLRDDIDLSTIEVISADHTLYVTKDGDIQSTDPVYVYDEAEPFIYIYKDGSFMERRTLK